MSTLTVKVLESDLRCLEPLMPGTLEGCSRSLPDVNLFVSLRLIQSMGSKRCATFVKERTVKPVWEEEFSLMVEEQDAELELVVYNLEHHGGHRFVGSAVLRVSELEGGETTDEWYLLSLHPDLISGGGPEDPLLRVQLTLAAFRWDPLPPRPPDFVPLYRMPTRPLKDRACCRAPGSNWSGCPVS